MNATKEKDSRIPKGDGCFTCPYYDFNSQGYKTYCWRYKERVLTDGFRGIRIAKCKKEFPKKRNKK